MPEEFPPKCPNCRSKKVTYESVSEYTGGGYADYWYEFECQKCGNVWRSEKKYDYS